MSLPILSFMWSEIADGWHALTNSSSDKAPLLGVPTLHIILALNVITQAICVSSVNNLTSVRVLLFPRCRVLTSV